MAGEPTTVEEVLGALERTLLRGSAQIVFRYDPGPPDLPPPAAPMPRREGGSLWRHAASVAGHVAGETVVRVSQRGLAYASGIMTRGATGIVDFAAGRSAHRYCERSGVTMIAEDRSWYGAPGSPVDRLTARRASAPHPRWMVDLLRGTVDAREDEPEELDGRRTRRFSAHADLTRAAAAVSYRMAIPAGAVDLDELERLALEIWVDDDGCIRRIRLTGAGPTGAGTTTTLDLTELGIATPSDWSRIPAPPGA
jgi:hypothetical protein